MSQNNDQNQKRQDSQTPALDFFCTDITKEASEGKMILLSDEKKKSTDSYLSSNE